MKSNKSKTSVVGNDKLLHQKLMNLRNAISQKIVGQNDLIENILVCLLASGHMLIEGMPGLAKTTAAKAVADGLEGNFHRIQFNRRFQNV